MVPTPPHGPARFSPAELLARRRRVLETLPDDALVLVRGGRPVAAMQRFRQTNDFAYLTGLEVPGAYLLLDARTREATVYLAHRDAQRERNDGPMLAAEDAAVVTAATGAEHVAGVERLAADLARVLFRAPRPVFLPLAPEEGPGTTRDSALAAAVWAAADPFDDVPDPAAALGELARAPVPPARGARPLARARRAAPVKSESELERMRVAARLCGLAVIEAMRSTARASTSTSSRRSPTSSFARAARPVPATRRSSPAVRTRGTATTTRTTPRS